MDLKNISIAAVLALALLPAAAGAQTIEVLSYAPLKRAGGADHSYQFISVKSHARFATDAAAKLIINKLRANTPHLTLETQNIAFSGASGNAPDISVRNDFFMGPSTALKTSNLNVGGYLYTNQNNIVAVVAENPVYFPPHFITYYGIERVSAQNIFLARRKGIQLAPKVGTTEGTKVYIDGIPLQAPTYNAPSCKVMWLPVCADTPNQTASCNGNNSPRATSSYSPSTASFTHKVLACVDI